MSLMMKNFIIYPKKGESFPLTFTRFALEGERFVLYDSINEPSTNGYLSFENIAAVCIEEQRYPIREDLRRFEVRLKNQSEPLNIHADCFKIESGAVEFYLWNIRGRDKKIDDIYIAASEVVSITPAGGLNKYVD